MSDGPQQRVNSLHPQDRELQLQQRQRARDRRKLIGLLAIALFILLLAFLRFGKSIPWGAR
ncbi:MAG: hypothetical protein ABSD98_02350 [Candidatus Korobacteraceae bacterium]